MASNRYIFTSWAREDLDSILTYIFRVLGNPPAAKDFYNHVFKHLENLCSYPECFPLIENEFVKREDIRKIPIDNYVLYYTYDKEKSIISVLRIVYARRDIDEILKRF